MADLTSADVTVAVEDRQIEGKKKRNRVKITFGDASDTYPSGGVPMPEFGQFGMVRNLDYLNMFDADDAQGLIFKYDSENHKVRMYEGDFSETGDASFVELDSGSDAVAATTIYAEAVGW